MVSTRKRPVARTTVLAVAATALLLGAELIDTPSASAGCGCEKPPPPPSSARPSVTYAGAPVSLFHAGLKLGVAYRVRFVSASGVTADAVGTGFDRRDLADGVFKTHLTVPLPNIPLGPAAIEVYDAKNALLFAIPDHDFTVAPGPVVLPSTMGANLSFDYRAAIGRDGTVYITADLSALQEARTLDIWGNGLPLQFGSDDVSFYNTQGFLMQLLDRQVPGLLAFDALDVGKYQSSRLRYFRHEFETYFLAHGERETHAIDPLDPDWHLDGTRHIDHNHLVVAITGQWKDNAPHPPGATKAFKLTVNPLSEYAAPRQPGELLSTREAPSTR